MFKLIKVSHFESNDDINPTKNKFIKKMATDFLYHPENTSLKIKRLRGLPELTQSEIKSGVSSLGLCFASGKYHRIGSILGLTISTHGEEHSFLGQVVLIKENPHGYHVGVWLRSQTDASRLRIVEQILYIDSYLEDQQDQSVTPFNKEQGIQEWISQNAAQIPA